MVTGQLICHVALHGDHKTMTVIEPLDQPPVLQNITIMKSYFDKRKLLLHYISPPDSDLQLHTCFLSSVLIGQSYMTCLKHATLKHDNVNAQWVYRSEFVPWICYSWTFFMMSLFIQKADAWLKQICLVAVLIPMIFVLEKTEIFTCKIKKNSRATRHVLLQNPANLFMLTELSFAGLMDVWQIKYNCYETRSLLLWNFDGKYLFYTKQNYGKVLNLFEFKLKIFIILLGIHICLFNEVCG